MAGFGGFGPAQGIIATAVVDNGTPVAGGTANGVLYVNSSGNLDSGSALTWDGSAILSLVTNSAAIKLGASSNVVLTWDAAGILAQRNGTNAQVFRIYNTFTSASVYEAFNIDWQTTANICTIRTSHVGATGRTLRFAYSTGVNPALQIPISLGANPIEIGASETSSTASAIRVRIGSGGTTTATTGTHNQLILSESPAPSSSSAMIWNGLQIAPTINYASGGAGQIKIAYFNPTNTALPTGLNAACVFSSTASALGGMHFHNQTDEATNYEIARTYFTGNVFTIESTAGGSGTVRNINISVANAAASAVVTEVATSTITGGVTDGYTAGLRQTPTYTAATAQTVTRHNYLDLNNPTLSGAGPAALTDACVVRFNAAAGTHKAVDSGTTKTTPGTVDAWVKVNVNGTIYYIPSYTSKTT